MFARFAPSRFSPLPAGFLSWQVELCAWTVRERMGVPHAGVAPLVLVDRRDTEPRVSAHSVVCNLLQNERHLEPTTLAFREIYERHINDGSRAVLDAGLVYLEHYYGAPDRFDQDSLTTLVPARSVLATGLRAAPECALVFHVFDLDSRAPGVPVRCQQLFCTSELHVDGPVYENAWRHNALFHGLVDDHVVVRFRHRHSFEGHFGRWERFEP